MIQAPHRTVTDYGKGHVYKHSKKVQENGTKRGCNGHTEMIQAEPHTQGATKCSNVTDYRKGHIHNHSKTLLVQENDTKKEMGTQN